MLGKIHGAFGLLRSVGLKGERLFAGCVEAYDFCHAVGGDGHEVDRHATVGAVGDESGERVGFEEVVGGVGGLELYVALRKGFGGFHVDVHLVVEAALEFGALSGKLLRVGRDVLETCGGCAYGTEVFHPCGAAEFASARAYSANASGFLARADLLHFYAHVERVGKHFDEFAEVNACVGYVVEDGFVAVALVLHVADFHLQLKVLGYLSGANHGVVLACLGFFVFFHVAGACLAVYALYFGALLEVGLLHLQQHEFSSEGHNAYVVSRLCFHGYGVAFGEVDVVVVAVESLSGVFKLHFHVVCHVVVAGHVGEVVERVELVVGASASAGCYAAE